jgi:acetyl-CoA C-acetyltransferase
LHEVKPIDLVVNQLNALRLRNSLDTSLVEDLILATGEPVDEQGQNLAKAAITYADWSDATTGAQLHRFCAGGLDAVNLAFAKIAAGIESLNCAGGVESMSRLGIGASGGAVSDPWVAWQSDFVPQGVAADLIANLNDFDREQLDTYGVLSQARATQAQTNGHFRSLVPVVDMNGVTILNRDETIRPQTTAEGLADLSPVFESYGALGYDELIKFKYPQIASLRHHHTQGTSSGIADGAALVLLGNQQAGKQLSIEPRARIVATALVGTEPTIMLCGPAPAARKALAQADLNIEDIDLFEVNEAFASVVLLFAKELELPMDKINVNGGAIAMGHPIGATGAMLVGSLIDELERRQLRRGMVTLCAGGGIGIATIIERV